MFVIMDMDTFENISDAFPFFSKEGGGNYDKKRNMLIYRNYPIILCSNNIAI